jgi:type III pantothenate kinase
MVQGDYHQAMEINLMVLNVGNSRLAVGVFVAGKLEHTERVDVRDREAIRRALASAWERIEGRPNAEVAGASVNPSATETVGYEAAVASGQKVQWVGRDLDLPISVKTDQPELTGVDRVLGVAAAYEQLGHACVVVDAGTAITVNVCDDAGAFLGGAIAPGLRVQLSSLARTTAQLPEVGPSAPVGVVGTSTEQAILHGVYSGARGLVREVVERFAGELSHWPEVIVTGGDGAELYEGWELVHAVAPDLTLYGIALAYSEHHIRHRS